MDLEKLIAALEETISYLKLSQASDWSSLPVEEIIRRLEREVAKARSLKPMDVNLLERLFAPTGAIQEISIDNGWGTRFLRISEIVDEFIGGQLRPSPQTVAVFQAIFVTVLWASSWVLIKLGLRASLPALTFAGLRYVLAFVCLMPFVLLNPAH